MKTKSGFKVKLKASIFSPRQIWGFPLNNALDSYLSASDFVGMIVMWIAFILSLPVLVIYLLFSFPVRFVLFCKKLRNASKALIEDNKGVFYEIKEERKC